jgi:hypothetical protein
MTGGVKQVGGAEWVFSSGGNTSTLTNLCGSPTETWNFAAQVGRPATESTAGYNEGDFQTSYTVTFNIPVVCCNGETTTSTTLDVQKLERQAVINEETEELEWTEWTPVAGKDGSGSVTVTITNNGCCHDGEDCVEIESEECDGTCPEM